MVVTTTTTAAVAAVTAGARNQKEREASVSSLALGQWRSTHGGQMSFLPACVSSALTTQHKQSTNESKQCLYYKDGLTGCGPVLKLILELAPALVAVKIQIQTHCVRRV